MMEPFFCAIDSPAERAGAGGKGQARACAAYPGWGCAGQVYDSALYSCSPYPQSFSCCGAWSRRH